MDTFALIVDLVTIAGLAGAGGFLWKIARDVRNSEEARHTDMRELRKEITDSNMEIVQRLAVLEERSRHQSHPSVSAHAPELTVQS
ncbi:MAG: hypothetical protein OXE59_01145 [Bacteroidetes bacterium]|nr:hypothetical protein [Bacteroidota bacterium]